jgi:hypothetical protein
MIEALEMPGMTPPCFARVFAVRPINTMKLRALHAIRSVDSAGAAI